jgi:hypothetical protein
MASLRWLSAGQPWRGSALWQYVGGSGAQRRINRKPAALWLGCHPYAAKAKAQCEALKAERRICIWRLAEKYRES